MPSSAGAIFTFETNVWNGDRQTMTAAMLIFEQQFSNGSRETTAICRGADGVVRVHQRSFFPRKETAYGVPRVHLAHHMRFRPRVRMEDRSPEVRSRAVAGERRFFKRCRKSKLNCGLPPAGKHGT